MDSFDNNNNNKNSVVAGTRVLKARVPVGLRLGRPSRKDKKTKGREKSGN